MKDIFEITGVILIVIVGIIAIFAVVGTPIYLLERAACNRVATDSERRTEYRFIGGCYVEVNGRLIPQDNWRGEYEQ